MSLNARGNNFFENFGDEVEVLNWTKIVEIDGFLRRGWTRACLNDDGKIPSEREIDKICDDWTKFIEGEVQKESWDGIQGTFLLSEAEMSL